MKEIKNLLVLFILIAFTGCGNDSDTVTASLDFTIENLIGSYQINSYNADLVNTANTQGTDVVISTATKVGDTFQIDFTLNESGTFSAIGAYRVTTTVTPVSGSQNVNQEILNIDNEGTFSISTTGARTITFNSTTGSFLNGEYAVNFLNAETLTLFQEKTEVDGSITTRTQTTISFGREQ